MARSIFLLNPHYISINLRLSSVAEVWNSMILELDFRDGAE